MKYLESILDKKGFLLNDGQWYSLTSAISIEEADFLRKLIKENNSSKTLEIGCAEGVSAMVICDIIGEENVHTMMDPNQTGHWKSMGVNNLKKAGYNNFALIEDFSEFVLPRLLKDGKQYDFIFVDGWHTFDHVMMEFFYINRLLSVGGVVVFDDTALPPLNKLMRYISNYPNFEVIGSAGEFYESKNRKLLDRGKKIINLLSMPLGKKLKNEFLNDMIIRSNESLKIDGSIAAFRKTAKDERGWAWYQPF